MNVVVLVEGGLVEVVQSTALLRTLEAGDADIAVTLACPPAASVLLGALPGVAELLPMRSLTPRGAASFAADWRRLRRRRFDAAILCGSSPRLRWLAHLAGIPRRAGPAGGATQVLLTDPFHAPRRENRAALWARGAAVLGAGRLRPEPWVDPGEPARQVAADAMARAGLAPTASLVVALAPGRAWLDAAPARAISLRWPPTRFVHVANQLAMRRTVTTVLLGSPDDCDTCEELHPDLGMPYVDLCGQLSLREAAAVLERCDLFVGNDSPLLQLAAAVRTPSVGVFGAGSDGRVRGPYGDEQRAVQALRVRRDRRRRNVEVDSDRRHPLIWRVRVDDVVAWIEAA